MALRLLHTADLHIGKRVNGMSMIGEQRHFISQLQELLQAEHFDGVIIAGDVFDRAIPSREALETCELLFSSICSLGVPVFAIPGNHDSPQQLSFCSHLLEPSGLHIAKAYDGHIDRFELSSGSTNVCIHLLPFVRPTDVRMAHPSEADAIGSHHDAVSVALSHDELAPDACNILVAHQFVTGGGTSPETCDSEIISIGGTDNVDASLFDAYDYVALGHLHGPQRILRDGVRYSGSPLKYSFSEARHKKSVTVIEIEGKNIELSTRAIEPLHDMREICASYQELLDGADEGSKLDYMRVTLTDKSLPDAMAKLRDIYPNILRLDWQEYFTPVNREAGVSTANVSKTPLELFSDYYELQTGAPLTDPEREIVRTCVEEGGGKS